jgi:hypothetical protein
MRKITIMLLVALFAVALNVKGQDCASSFFPSKEGTKIEMTSYDKNGKATGKSVTTIVAVKKVGAVTEISLKAESTDSKNTATSTEYTAKCDGDNLSISMKGLIPSDMQKAYGEGSLTMDASDLVFPNSIAVGQKLNDGAVTMNISMGSMNMKMIINILNRTVTGKESITTPSGTYDCFKIEYDMETTAMGMKTKGKVKQWIAKGTGTVRSENYGEKGDLMGYSLITSLK